MWVWMAAGVLTLFLVGCGNEDDDDAQKATLPAKSAPSVVIQIAGAYEGSFEANGAIFCSKDEFGGPEEGFELYAIKSPEQFNLKMPRRTSPGVYSMTDGNTESFDFYYTDPNRVKYDNVDSATIRLDSVPQAQGERLVGSIEATLQSRKGESVDVQVNLDLAAGAQSFDECR